MRMRKRQNLAPRMEACRSVWLEDAAYLRGNWRSLMPQARELRLEIGCGKGKFTVETAALEPDVLFVAVERVQEAPPTAIVNDTVVTDTASKDKPAEPVKE